MVSVHTRITNTTLSQRPIIEQLCNIYSAARCDAAAITPCPEMETLNEKNWVIVEKMGSSVVSAESQGQM